MYYVKDEGEPFILNKTKRVIDFFKRGRCLKEHVYKSSSVKLYSFFKWFVVAI